MYQASEAFIKSIMSSSRSFLSKIEVDGKDIGASIRTIVYNAASNASDYISIGGAVSASVQVTMEKPSVSMENTEFTLYLGLDIDGTKEYVKTGIFTVEKTKLDDGLLTFTAYDRMSSKLSGAYFSDLTETHYPADGKEILQEIADMAGVPVVLSDLPDGVTIDRRAVVTQSGVDEDGNEISTTTYENPFAGYTYREALGYVAQFYGRFATINRDGEIELRWYETADYTVTASKYYDDLVTAEQNFALGAIECEVGESTLVSGSGTAGIQISNPVMTQSRLDAVYSAIKDFTFLPSSLTFFGDVRLDLGDIVTVNDKHGNQILLPVMKLTLDYDGGLITGLASFGKTEAESASGAAKGPTAQALDRVYSDLFLVKELIGQKASFDYVYAQSAEIKNLTAEAATINDLVAKKANITDLNATNATVSDLSAEYAAFKSTTADELKAHQATIDSLDTDYAKIDLANVNNAWIQNGTIKDASIADAKIIGVSANKLTAGTIDASKINVTNLNADNLTVGTINGKLIGSGTVDLDSLAEEVPTKAYLDSVEADLQKQIDGAIETFTVTEVPTLSNTPAKDWTDNATKLTHVGDVAYVVNSASSADGYCYRFTNTGTTAAPVFEWTLIKDSDVTKALQELVDAQGDISGLKSFETSTSKWMTNTDSEVSSLMSRMTTAETNLGTKVDTSTFNEVKQTVDENSAAITTMSETVSTKADGSTVTELSNTVNTVKQTADANSSNISSLAKKVDTKADGSTVTTLTTRTSSLEQNLSEFKSTVSETYVTNETYSEKVSGLENDISTAQNTANSAASTANTANSNASSAVTKANSAVSTANTASANASSALNKATDLETRADNGEFKGDKGDQGEKGDKGDKGDTGAALTVKSKAIEYQAGTSGTTAPTGTWQSSVPSVAAGSYLWTRTTVTYSDSTSVVSYSVARQGTNGTNGTNGTSPTVSSTKTEYTQSTSGTNTPSSGWSTTPPTATAGRYMWTRTTVTYSDGKTSVSYMVTKNGGAGYKANLFTRTAGTYTDVHHVGKYGVVEEAFRGIYGKTITISFELEAEDLVYTRRVGLEPVFTNGTKYYYLSAFYESNADGITKNTLKTRISKTFYYVPEWISEYTEVLQTEGYIQGYISGECKIYNFMCVEGSEPAEWSYAASELVGAQGVSVTSQKNQYYLSTSNTTQTGGSWADTPPVKTSNTYIWTRLCYTLSDGSTNYSTAVLDNALNDVVNRITSAETNITQNKEAIELRATKTEVESLTDSLDARLTSAESSITQNAESIELRVTQSDYDAKVDELEYTDNLLFTNAAKQDTRLTNAESSITQNAENIELKVSKDGVISAINQTSESVTINASKINLTGYITATDLATSGSTIINGSNITTGTISADRLDVNAIFAKNITATGIITGATLNGAKISTISGTIGGWTIDSNGLSATSGSNNLTVYPDGITINYGSYETRLYDEYIYQTSGNNIGSYYWYASSGSTSTGVRIWSNGALRNTGLVDIKRDSSIPSEGSYYGTYGGKIVLSKATLKYMSGVDTAEVISLNALDGLIYTSGNITSEGIITGGGLSSNSNVSASGCVYAASGVQIGGFGGSNGDAYAQLRIVGYDSGFMIRNDGSDIYFMITNVGDAYGVWNSYRPLRINALNGMLTFGGNSSSVYWYMNSTGAGVVTFTDNGNFVPMYGPGTSNPGVYNLGSGSNYWKGVYYTSLNQKSDRRIKNPQGDVPESEALAILNELTARRYNLLKESDNVVHYGFYAQDFRDILLTHGMGYRAALNIGINGTEDETTNLNAPEDSVTYALSYTEFIPVLFIGWKYHERRIKELEEQISSLHTILDQAFAAIAGLEKKINS